jgi:hypothetical protein
MSSHVGLQLLQLSPTDTIDQQVISDQRQLRIDPRCNLDSYAKSCDLTLASRLRRHV